MKIIITGGAGFIGSNAANRYCQAGHEVVIMDNLSRNGASLNLKWLQKQGVAFLDVDIRDAVAVASVLRKHDDVDRILHLAAQVAVTTSVTNPRFDFEVNALGTFNLLEAMRASSIAAPVIYSSTNKVYGKMEDVGVKEEVDRYSYVNLPFGVSELKPIDFHSPYGCSKGAADQYVIDYHRVYGLRTVVFRQSCIFGCRQFGAEEQGWVAWFMIARQLGLPVTIFGDGKQVRDILFVDDLIDAYDAAYDAIDTAAGRVFNIGGGPNNVLSLRQLVSYVESREKHKLDCNFAGWRPGDQKIFVSDIRRASGELGWRPKTPYLKGLDTLYDWIKQNEEMFKKEHQLAWSAHSA